MVFRTLFITFSRSLLEDEFQYFENILNVSTSNFSKDSDFPSYLLQQGASNLGTEVVNARRALKNCTKNNVCAFGCPTGSKITPFDSIVTPLI